MTTERAFEMGKEAFEKGWHSAPALNAEFLKEALFPGIKAKTYHELTGAYLDGWHRANLDAPIPGWEPWEYPEWSTHYAPKPA